MSFLEHCENECENDDNDDDEMEAQRRVIDQQHASLSKCVAAIRTIPFQRLFGLGSFDVSTSWEDLERRCLVLKTVYLFVDLL